jgi:HemY protein
MLAPPAPRKLAAEPPRDVAAEPAAAPVEPEPLPAKEPAAQDNAPPPTAAEPVPVVAPAPPPPPAESAPVAATPVFRSRQDIPKGAPSSISPVIPIIRAPDDPGIDDDGPRDEFSEQIAPPKAQAGGWRGFLSRFGGA